MYDVLGADKEAGESTKDARYYVREKRNHKFLSFQRNSFLWQTSK